MREVAFKAAARRLQQRCFEPIDIGALVYFRVVFGGLMFLELLRYMTRGQLRMVWIDPTFHFKYPGFEWVKAPPDQWIYPLAGLLLAGATGITLGLFYRISATVFAVGFTWLFLMEAAHYLNHFYLICLLSFLAILVPANRRLAVDTWRKPSLRSEVAPAWTLWLIRFQIAIVYIYGGFAKLNADWLRGRTGEKLADAAG